MPLYDCGDRDCQECQTAFGSNREKAIRNFEAREAHYATLSAVPPATKDDLPAAYATGQAK